MLAAGEFQAILQIKGRKEELGQATEKHFLLSLRPFAQLAEMVRSEPREAISPLSWKARDRFAVAAPRNDKSAGFFNSSL
jgi:hypothetical protein